MKRFISSVLVILLLLSALPVCLSASAGGAPGYIYLYEDGSAEDGEYHYYDVYVNGEVMSVPVDGVTYDPAANALTLDGVKQPGLMLGAGDMGESFTVTVKGECALADIECFSYDEGVPANLMINGDGSLTLNGNKRYEYGIYMYSKLSDAQLTLGKDVKVKIYGSGDNVVKIESENELSYSSAVRLENKSAPAPEYEAGSYPRNWRVGKYLEPCFALDNMNINGISLGAKTLKTDDPDGIYASMDYGERVNGEFEPQGKYVQKLFYSDDLGLFLPLSSESMSFEEFEARGYYLEDPEGYDSVYNAENVDRYYDALCHTDGSGNKYFILYSDEDEHGQIQMTVYALEPVAGLENGYLMTETDVDPDALTFSDEEVNCYLIGGKQRISYNHGTLLKHADDPDSIYVKGNPYPIYDDNYNATGSGYLVTKYIYLEEYGTYAPDVDFTGEHVSYGSRVYTDEQLEAEGFEYIPDEHGSNMEFTTDYPLISSYGMIQYVKDKEGNEYLGSVYFDNDGEHWLLYTSEPMKGMEGYMLNYVGMVDIDEMERVYVTDETPIYYVNITGNYYSYPDGKQTNDPVEPDEPGGDVMIGDADLDGEVTILDATTIQRHLVGLAVENFSEAAADADGDGEVTILDATTIQRYLVGLPNKSSKIGENAGGAALKEALFLVPTGAQDENILFCIRFDPETGKGWASYIFTDDDIELLKRYKVITINKHFSEITDEIADALYLEGMPELTIDQKAQWFGEILMHFYGLFVKRNLDDWDYSGYKFNRLLDKLSDKLNSCISAEIDYNNGVVGDTSHGKLSDLLNFVSKNLGMFYIAQ